MKKRIFAALLALCMAAALLPAGALADGEAPSEEMAEEPLSLEAALPEELSGGTLSVPAAEALVSAEEIEKAPKSGTCGENLTWKFEDGILTVSGSGPMADYDAAAESTLTPWYSLRTVITSVVVNSGVTSIGSDAFSGCSSLKNITLPSGITEIPHAAFFGCTSLTDIDIPDAVRSIGSAAFQGCSSLNELYLPDGLTAIEESTFSGCTSLNALYFPASIETVKANAFLDCDSLEVILYPGTEIQLSELYVADGNDILFTEIFYLIITESPFEDVTGSSETNWYYDPVLWAVNLGITNGTSETTFSPGDCCTRAQAVTFLWRAAGEPEPASTKMVFTDVKEGAYYYDAVLWAMEQEITNGTSETAFSPNASCTRAQIVTFLYRLDREPGAVGETFPDVKAGAYYYNAVLWATEAGITNGTSATAFSPDNDCTRAQIVTFLYRYATGGPEA